MVSECDACQAIHRWYDAATGRWISEDPIGFEAGDANLYRYVGNNATNDSDPTGLYTLKDALHNLVVRNFPNGVRPTDKEVFDEWIRLEKGRGPWWQSLSKCPSKICVEVVGNGRNRGRRARTSKPGFEVPSRIGYHEARFHPGGYWSMRSEAQDGHSNQCVYDKEGNIIREAPGHGTVDWQQPTSFGGSHIGHDVAPVVAAAKLDGCWDSNGVFFGRIMKGCRGANMRKYFEVRPLWAEDDSDHDPCNC